MSQKSDQPILKISRYNARDRHGILYFSSVHSIILILLFIFLPFSLVMLFEMTSVDIVSFIVIFSFIIFLSAIFLYFLYVSFFNYLYNQRKKRIWHSVNDFDNKLATYRLKWIAGLSILIYCSYIFLPQQTTLLMLIIVLVWAIIDTISSIYGYNKQDGITEFYCSNGTLSAHSFAKYPYLWLSFFREWSWPSNKDGEFELVIFHHAKDIRKKFTQYRKAKSLTMEEFEQIGQTQDGITKHFFMLYICTRNIPRTFVLKYTAINFLVVDRLSYTALNHILLKLQNYGRIKIIKEADYSSRSNILSSKKAKIIKRPNPDMNNS